VPICIKVPNFVQVGQAVPEIWPFIDFSRWRPSAILYFKKLEILTAHALRSPKMRHRAKFRANQSRRCGYGRFSIFQVGSRPPSWIFKS